MKKWVARKFRFQKLVMNPPFTRQERLSKEYKALDDHLKEYKLHGQFGLRGYFIFLADRFLKSGLAFVLPAPIPRITSND